MAKATLVLVHGAWHSPKHFAPLKQHLGEFGYKAVAVALPSSQSEDTPPASLADDTNAIRSAVVEELDLGNNVVIVAHSYGGVPTNNALEGLGPAARKSQGKATCVSALVFISAFPVTAGSSPFDDILGGHSAPWQDPRGDFVWIAKTPGPEQTFYGDLPIEEAKKLSKMLRPQSARSFATKTTHAAFLDIPCFYIRCEKDQALPLLVQDKVIAAAESAGVNMHVLSLNSDHSPFVGKYMQRTGEFIRQAAGENFQFSHGQRL